jgi:hypothetical protein
MRSIAWVVALALAACTGAAPLSDGGQKCIGIAYDPCNTEHDCNNGNCVPFADKGFQVCSAACTPGDDTTCPTQDLMRTATCTANGVCEPPAPNSCKIQ